LAIPQLDGGESVAEAFNALAAGMQTRIGSAEARAELLSAALNSSPEAVIAVDAEYQIAFANEAAGRLFDRSAAELTGSPLVWVMADEKVVAAVRAGGSGKPETQLIERPGKKHLR